VVITSLFERMLELYTQKGRYRFLLNPFLLITIHGHFPIIASAVEGKSLSNLRVDHTTGFCDDVDFVMILMRTGELKMYS
jgi:hypothetical protein